jgi:6-phosphogluconolactonase
MSAAAQVSFDHDGTHLIVTEKMGNRLDVFPVDESGVAGPPVEFPSNGMTPFGFAVGPNGNLYVSEAFGGMPGASALSSYSVGEDGSLSVIDGSVTNGQTATCWVVATNSGRNIFVSNTGSGTVSSYLIGRFGRLVLNQGVAADLGAKSSPIDMALSNNSRFLYVLEGGGQTIAAFQVSNHGDLTSIGEFGSLPMGSQGIASK